MKQSLENYLLPCLTQFIRAATDPIKREIEIALSSKKQLDIGQEYYGPKIDGRVWELNLGPMKKNMLCSQGFELWTTKMFVQQGLT